MTVPTGVQVEALFTYDMDYVSAGGFVLVTSLDQTNTVASASAFTGAPSATLQESTVSLEIRTNTSAQIRERAAASALTRSLITHGWIDYRGQL